METASVETSTTARSHRTPTRKISTVTARATPATRASTSTVMDSVTPAGSTEIAPSGTTAPPSSMTINGTATTMVSATFATPARTPTVTGSAPLTTIARTSQIPTRAISTTMAAVIPAIRAREISRMTLTAMDSAATKTTAPACRTRIKTIPTATTVAIPATHAPIATVMATATPANPTWIVRSTTAPPSAIRPRPTSMRTDSADTCDPCSDSDGDGFGDAGFPNPECAVDNCQAIANPGQVDADGDGQGDVCDPCTDSDGDGFGDPLHDNPGCAEDNCPGTANPGQTDLDADGRGDACDLCTDSDGDGFGNPGFGANQCLDDNCPDVSNVDQTDTNGDGLGDACDACPDDPLGDPDLDGVCNSVDNCPGVANVEQGDFDSDGSRRRLRFLPRRSFQRCGRRQHLRLDRQLSQHPERAAARRRWRRYRQRLRGGTGRRGRVLHRGDGSHERSLRDVPQCRCRNGPEQSCSTRAWAPTRSEESVGVDPTAASAISPGQTWNVNRSTSSRGRMPHVT